MLPRHSRKICRAMIRTVLIAFLVLLTACAEMADPLYPEYSRLVGHFVEYEAEYTAATSAFANDPEFVEVYCDGDYREGRTSEDHQFIEFEGDAAARYAEICGPLRLLHMRKTERGIVVYMLVLPGKDGRLFVPSFVLLGDRAVETETCYLHLRLAETGTCVLELNERWVLMYQWAPRDELEAVLD